VRIAIAGAGLTGAYLYRLLREKQHGIEIYGRDPKTRCGINPCAWGTSRGFTELVRAAGLDPDKYLLRRLEYLLLDGMRIEGDLTTFDKPTLINDLLQGTEVIRTPMKMGMYDRIIDATGVSRAFLPRLQDDLLLPCRQWRVRVEGELENQIKLGRIGYAWCFPLSSGEYHIGCGSLLSDPLKIMEELGWLNTRARARKGRMICSCSGKIRITGPVSTQPFFRKDGPVEIWGVGESIGCVAPLAGDGIVPGMRSARILLGQWEDPAGYRQAILREFEWMERERVVIDKLKSQEVLTLKDAWVLRKNSRRMGMKIGVREAGRFLKSLR
jgi:hypothetical protein